MKRFEATEINYAGIETGGAWVTMFEAEDGRKFTLEQWTMLQFMFDLQEKLDTLEPILRSIAPRSFT